VSEKLAGISSSEIAQITASEQDPWTLYLYAMKSPGKISKNTWSVLGFERRKRSGQEYDFL
jgi:hypothetical protein